MYNQRDIDHNFIKIKKTKEWIKFAVNSYFENFH